MEKSKIDNIISNVSTNIKYLRKKNNDLQEDVGKIIGKAPNTVSQYENGVLEPSAIDVIKISNHYGVSLDDMMKKDLRFENVKDIGDEITKEDFDRIVSNLIDRCINMTDEDKKYYKRSLDIEDNNR